MKKFLLKTTIFTIVLIICIVVFWTIICSTRSETLRLPNNENIVFLGNSHIECAVNDSIVKNSFNFARSGDNLEHTYLKLKLIKQFNRQIDTVIIGYDDVLMGPGVRDSLTYISGMSSPYFLDSYTTNDIFEIIYNSNFEYICGHISHTFDWFKLQQILFAKNAREHTNLGGGYVLDSQ